MTASQQPASDHQPSALSVWLKIGATVWVYYLLITIFIIVPPFVVPAMGFNLGLRAGTAVTLGGTLVAELIALCLLLAWLRRDGRTLSDLGWRLPTTRVALALGICFGLVYAAFTLWHPDIGRHATEISLFKLWGVVVGIFGGIIEEIIFRGFVLTELERIRASPSMQIIVSGMTFALIHIGYGFWSVLATFVMGMALAFVYLLGRRSLTAPIVSHAVINAIIEPWLLLYTITIYADMFGK